MRNDFLHRIHSGDPRFIARALSLAEEGGEVANRLLESLKVAQNGQTAHVIGITGSPGAGKSSLTDLLIVNYRGQGKRVAVIAVDPSSPFSGGAVLGDRVRMMRHTLDEGVFIRSLGSRGSLGGLSRPVRDAVKVFSAGGYDLIILETVGVGQSELDVMYVADTVVVVLTPAGGDQVQAAKAGIMEAADILIVNKAELPGAERVKSGLEEMLQAHKMTKRLWASGTFAEWQVPVLLASAAQQKGLREVVQALGDHLGFLQEEGRLELRRGRGKLQELRELLEERMIQEVRRMWDEDVHFKSLRKELLQGNISVKDALFQAEKLLTSKETLP